MIISQFGDTILRKTCKTLSLSEIESTEIKELISDMQKTLRDKKLGIGLAAPQVGVNKSIAIIELQKTDVRPDIEELSLVIINPKIIKTFGYRTQLWEGCISSGDGSANLFAKVPRYKKITLQYNNQAGKRIINDFDGLAAHVLQHEVDHLNGILFVDKVRDTTTYKTYKEYKKMQKQSINS